MELAEAVDLAQPPEPGHVAGDGLERPDRSLGADGPAQLPRDGPDARTDVDHPVTGADGGDHGAGETVAAHEDEGLHVVAEVGDPAVAVGVEVVDLARR